MKTQKTKSKTYKQLTSTRLSFTVVGIVSIVLLASFAFIFHQFGGYLLASITGQNDATIGQGPATNNTEIATKPYETSRTETTGANEGGSTTSDTKKKSTPKTTATDKSGSSSTTKTTTKKKKSSSSSSGSSSSASDIASNSACPGQSDISKTATVLVCMTSYARNYHDLGDVSGKTSLMNSAAAKAQDIEDCSFSHTACGRAFNYWFGVEGYTGGCQGENIAKGQNSPGEVFEDWMNSPTHRDNILYANFDDIGVAALDSGSGTIWVMHLGGC